MKDWNIPGAALLVVKDGEVVLSRAYGVKEYGKTERVDENTLFMIASNTKAFTGTAMAMLVSEDKCNLDDRVKKWLPDFTMKDPWVTEHVTLTDIMCHRLGLETFQGDFMYWESDLTRDQVIQKFGELTPMYDFRAKWGYCNAGFVIAGKCLEEISGVSWQDFLKENIFEPLEMNRTLALNSEYNGADNVCSAHTLVDSKITVVPSDRNDNLAAAAGISSSINDLSHWILALLDSGRYQGKQVIPWQAIQTTRLPVSIIGEGRHPFNSGHFSLYGLGWELEDYAGKEIVSHTGGTDGFVTSVTLLPEEDLGVVVLTNSDMNGFYQAFKWEIIDAYLGLPYRNYSKYFLQRYNRYFGAKQSMVEAKKDTIAMKLAPPVKLKKFAGRYYHKIYGWADLKLEGDHLIMTLQHHPQLTGKLEHISNNRFLCTYSIPLWGTKVFPFKVINGKVISFTLSVDDFLEFTTYEFVKQK